MRHFITIIRKCLTLQHNKVIHHCVLACENQGFRLLSPEATVSRGVVCLHSQISQSPYDYMAFQRHFIQKKSCLVSTSMTGSTYGLAHTVSPNLSQKARGQSKGTDSVPQWGKKGKNKNKKKKEKIKHLHC